MSDAQSTDRNDAETCSRCSRNPGIVYVLSNPAMPNYVKIGRTHGNRPQDVLDRMREIDKTGVPRAFYCEYAAVVVDYKEAEQVLLKAFGENRVRPNREFLEGIPPYRVIALLKFLALQDVTPRVGLGDAMPNPDGNPPERPPRMPSVRFSKIGIEPGDLLQWADDPIISCKVIDNRRVCYKNREYALSRLTAILKGGKAEFVQVQPYWLFEEQTLGELWSDYLSSDDDDGSAE